MKDKRLHIPVTNETRCEGIHDTEDVIFFLERTLQQYTEEEEQWAEDLKLLEKHVLAIKVKTSLDRTPLSR